MKVSTAETLPRPIARRASERSRFLAGLWRLADPKISLASFAGLWLGAAAAEREGPISWGWLAATVLGIFCIEVAKNASGDVFDYDSGADAAVAPEDRSPFSGGKRVLVDRLLSRRQTWGIAAAAYGLGAGAGIAIAVFREPAILWLGLAGIACAWFYHAPPLKLSYRGLGESAVFLVYGPLICAGTFLVQRGGVDREILLIAVPLGLLIAGFLLVNEFPDYRADLGARKRNLVVRLGRQRAARLYLLLAGAAVAWIALAPLAGAPASSRLGLLCAVPAAIVSRILASQTVETARIIPAQRLALAAFLVYSTAASAGILVLG